MWVSYSFRNLWRKHYSKTDPMCNRWEGSKTVIEIVVTELSGQVLVIQWDDSLGDGHRAVINRTNNLQSDLGVTGYHSCRFSQTASRHGGGKPQQLRVDNDQKKKQKQQRNNSGFQGPFFPFYEHRSFEERVGYPHWRRTQCSQRPCGQ